MHKRYCARWFAPVMLAVTVLAASGGEATAHGNVPIDQDPCSRVAGSYLVHFAAYQPQIDPKGHYCDEIPKAGSAIVVVDLVDRALRTIPVGLKIIDSEDHAMAEVAPRAYPTGVIYTDIEFDRPGRYAAIVTFAPPLSASSRLEFAVDTINYSKIIQRAAIYALSLLLVAWLGWKLRQVIVRRRHASGAPLHPGDGS